MGKYSDFERMPRDLYDTPVEAVAPLMRHLDAKTFCEPCAGRGKLIESLEKGGLTCVRAYDVYPLTDRAMKADALLITQDDVSGCDAIITNPPWDRRILHPMVEHFIELNKQAWLLFDADWAHTKQASDLIKFCSDIVSVGRVKWIPDSKHTGKENCAWYRFVNVSGSTRFHGRYK